MASSSTDEEVSKIIDNKENSIHSAQSGIEANDLAGLLCRFEEATTSSTDDISIPMRNRKNKKDLLMKAKSTGSSPAITPPATPTFPSSSAIKGRLARLPQSPALTGAHQLPITFKVVVTSGIAANTPSTPVGIHMSPDAVLSTGSPFPQGIYLTTTIAQPKAQSRTVWSQPQKSGSSLITLQATKHGTVPTNQILAPGKSISIVKAPIGSRQVCSPSINLSASKSLLPAVSTTLPSTSQNVTLRSMLTNQVVAPQIKSTISSSEILLPNTTVISNSTSSFQTLAPDSKDGQGLIPAKTNSNEAESFSKTELEEYPDHDYCIINSNARDSFQQQRRSSKIDSTPVEFEEEVWLTESRETFVDNDTTELAKSVPDKGTNSNSREPSKAEPGNEFVFEDGEVFIDAEGNDRFSPEPSNSCPNNPHEEEEVYSSHVTFFGDNTRKRKPRRYRRRAEFSTSPIREDTGNFYDKIPSYYTALSIPAKPTKTTIFASATKAIGSTDHLDMVVTNEPADDGHYDKVPAHRRCFTNTTKEVAVDHTAATEQCDEGVASAITRTHSGHYSSRHSSHSSPPRKSSSPNSRRSFSRHSSFEAGEQSSRYSPRRSRSMSRYSGRSSSSGSSCSTCSFCSTCSGSSRSPSFSRSRSRSCSSDYSRSRSRSSDRQRMRDRARRGQHREERRRSRPESSPEHSRWRSRSHSHRRRRLSHSSGNSRISISEKKKAREEEKIKAMEERRVVYVGKIPDNYTKRQLHQRFECFGEIKEVKVNFREHGDNYGFVTFAYACDAIAAKEGGNNIANAIKFDLCFGGRRSFCPDQYADLDGNREIEEEYAPMPKNLSDKLDYAALLKQHSKQRKKPS